MGKEDNLVDLAKWTAAIMVVAIHSFTEINNVFLFTLIDGICRIAVPMFFCISGYYLYKNMRNTIVETEKKAIVKNYMLRILKLYIIWSVIYMPYNIYEYIKKDYSIVQCICSYVRKFFVLGTYTQLWYLPALLFSVLFFAIGIKFFDVKRLFLVALLFFVFGIGNESYYGLIDNFSLLKKIYDIYDSIFLRTRIGLTFGFVFFVMGCIIAEYKILISKKYMILGVIASLICLVIEVNLLKTFMISRYYGMYLSLIPLEFFMCNLILKSTRDIKIGKHIRKQSTFIYCSQLLFIRLFKNLLGIGQLGVFILTLVCCIGTFEIICLVDKEKKIRKMIC